MQTERSWWWRLVCSHYYWVQF